VNRLLADLYETWSTRREERDSVQQLSKDLSSHSARHGGAQDASDHKDIQLQWIIPRGKYEQYYEVVGKSMGYKQFSLTLLVRIIATNVLQGLNPVGIELMKEAFVLV